MEKKMIDYCASRGLVYMDFFWTKSGNLIFLAKDKRGSEHVFKVVHMGPLIVTDITPR